MSNHNNTAFNSEQNKGKKYAIQEQRVFAEFFRTPQTMMQVDVKTGIMRSSICPIVERLRKRGAIASYSVGTCPITKHPKVNRWTTDPDKFPQSNQLKLPLE